MSPIGSSDKRRRLLWRCLMILLLGCALSALLGCEMEPPALKTPAASPTTPPMATPSATPFPPTPTATPSPTPLTKPALWRSIPLPAPPAPGHNPNDIALLDGMAYVTNWATSNVSILDERGVRAVVSVGRHPNALAADPASGRVFVLSGEDKRIDVLQGPEIVAHWPLPERGESLALVAGELWAGLANGRLYILSSTNGAARGEVTLSKKRSVLRICPSPDGQRAYVSTYNELYVVDVPHRRETAMIASNAYRTLAVSRDGRLLYIAGYDTQAKETLLTVLETDTLQERARLSIAPDASALVVDPRDGRLYLCSRFTHQLMALDGDSLQILASLPVGYQPAQAALDPQTGLLYVLNQGGDNVVLVNTATMTVRDTLPLALRIGDMAVDPAAGRLYLAASSSDRVLVLDGDELAGSWYLARHPNQVGVIPSMGWVAVASLVEDRVLLLHRDSFAPDQAARALQPGQLVTQYATGHLPIGLMVDEAQQRLYVGDTIIDWTRRDVRTLQIPTIYVPTTVPPVQMVRDTRRDKLYAVAFNGVPGSNGGNQVFLLTPQGVDHRAPTPGRLSVIELLYDEELDRFYSTYGRMGQYGLVVSQASDSQEIAHISLARYPQDMALNPTTHHLWLISLASSWEGETHEYSLEAYDTRTLEVVFSLALDGPPDKLAVDASRNRVYVASGEHALLYVVQDVALELPPQARTLPTRPPRPSPMPSPTPTCALEVADVFRDAWVSLGGRPALGCAYAPAEEGDWAVQPFERGLLYWRGSSRTLYALFEGEDGIPGRGVYRPFHDEWQEGMPAKSCAVHPPAGLYQPIRGFGLLWCRESIVGQMLGWATAPERGVRILHQSFEGGLLVREPDGAIRLLRSEGTWETLIHP